MNDKKITLDFTQVSGPDQELALMPAALAKRLLQRMADDLVMVSQREIVNSLIEQLEQDKVKGDKAVEAAITTCFNFVQERTLIENISKDNWEFYTIPEERYLDKS